jgi:hypothetical protein
MKQELAWGTAAAVAIVAAVGISSQPGGKSAASTSAGRQSGQAVITSKAASASAPKEGVQPQCADAISLLEHFFLYETIIGPNSCYAKRPAATPLPAAYQTDFVIATLPDPFHTHFSLSFDRLIEAIQQSAQDEGYDYDSSWLPWETEEPSLALLTDQDEAQDRKEKREAQPGMLLFRHSGESPYQKALIVFVVGEESTGGIHRSQFKNAVAWINALQQPNDQRTSVAILGPSFSGSFPSLKELLTKKDPVTKTDLMAGLNPTSRFPVYSGSASSREDGEDFAQTKAVSFRSFVQDDTTALGELCQYFGREHLDNVAILSEDETAYGYVAAKERFGLAKKPVEEANPTIELDEIHNERPADTYRVICPGAINVYYPRDISALRAAYQSQSMFSSGSTQMNPETVQRKSLPTDLADPAGQQHDTVRRYAGNQTALSQEAQLLGIVDVLRAKRIEYVILRSSNTLDPLFLANFLRRDYPEARIVILNADLLFQRGRDAMALTGVMTLSTYPLFAWAREWTALPFPDVNSHRVFPENFTEGTYIASRLLLQTLARENNEKPLLSCDFADKGFPAKDQEVFAPALRCQIHSFESEKPVAAGKPPKKDNSATTATLAPFAPLPDYAPPYWTEPSACGPDAKGLTCRPPMWLSVITRNGTLPLAALNGRTLSKGAAGTDQQPADSAEHLYWPTPRSTRVFLIALGALAVFHFLCCLYPSFTAKPAFRAHFATPGRRHTGLVLIGSFLIALMALQMGWGYGIFCTMPGPPSKTRMVWSVVASIWVVAGVAIGTNIVMTRRLNGDAGGVSKSAWRMTISLVLFAVFTAAFLIFCVRPLENALLLANRAFVHWRATHLLSGVSPVVPYLALAAGPYAWFWYALHGLALFGPDRPCLPPLETLGVKLTPQNGSHQEYKELKLSMFSQENVAERAERISKPLAWDNVIAIAVLFAVMAMVMFGLGQGVPVRSLATMSSSRYSLIFCLALCFYCAFLLSEAWQIWRTWSSVRQLLVFLDRMALRRTLSALHGFSWGSVWKMSGNVLDVRYKLLSRQLECLNHLSASLNLFKTPGTPQQQGAFGGIETCKESINLSRAEGLKFAEWYSENYCKSDASDLTKFQNFQKQIAKTTGVVLTELVVPATRLEQHSLIQVDPNDPRGEDRKGPPPSKNELIRNAEELVCLTYLGYAQNLLGRIRTIVLGGVYLFIALSIAVSSYPFDPRTLLSGILLLLFVAFGGVVIFTYADMHRDVTLSHITNTRPGELGSEFWFKVVGYGAAPLLGLITQVFPEWAGFLFSWLQPGLSPLK